MFYSSFGQDQNLAIPRCKVQTFDVLISIHQSRSLWALNGALPMQLPKSAEGKTPSAPADTRFVRVPGGWRPRVRPVAEELPLALRAPHVPHACFCFFGTAIRGKSRKGKSCVRHLHKSCRAHTLQFGPSLQLSHQEHNSPRTAHEGRQTM